MASSSSTWRVLTATSITLACLLTCPSVDAKEEEDPLSFDREIHRIFRAHCFRCHDSDDASGDVDLRSDENLRMILSQRKKWRNVRDVLKSGEMPPEDEKQPSDEHRLLMIQFLDRTLDTLACDTDSNPHTPPVRRLTRHQFDRTVLDFTGLHLKISDDFAPDPVSFGFEGVSGWQGLTQVIIDQYSAAATEISKALLQSKESHPKVYARFFSLPSKTEIGSMNSQERETLTRKRITYIARKAHRGTTDPASIDRLMKVYRSSFELHQEHDHAVADAVRGILMSPRFFMRIESVPQEIQSDSGDVVIAEVEDMGFANRLSYFLWSSPPDSALIKVAREGKLNHPDEIRKQTRRMLKHRRVRHGLGKEFFGQWLQIKDLADHAVDPVAFPQFDESLRSSMVGEVDHFVTEMIQKDMPVSTLVDSDFTFVDRRLAEHYSLQDLRKQSKAKPQGFVRVTLTDRRRGGLLTSAALLTLQADPGRTNIPRRGNFIAGTFLGDPPPPPPPDVPPLEEPDENDQSLTLREVFEKHRSDAGCASCHAKMDPIGFCLEHYDGIGRWREQDNGLPIDTTGELPSGEPLDGAASLKDFLLSKQPELTRSLTESLIVYALGRGLTPEDECIVREAIKKSDEQEGQFSAIIESIVTSRPFRFRSN